MIKTGTLWNCALAQLLCVSASVGLVKDCSAQRNISVVTYYGKVVTTYTKDVRGSASTNGLSGYGAHLVYAEPMTDQADILVGFGYHVQNLEWDITGGSHFGSSMDSMTVRASYFSVILGAKWYLDNAKHLSFFFDAQVDLPIANTATGRRKAYIPLVGDSDTLINGKLSSYGKLNIIPTIGFDYERQISSTYHLGIGCYFQYGMTVQWGDHLRTGEGGIRLFLKRNFLEQS